MVDYKFNFISDDGSRLKGRVTFYSGDITTENETGPGGSNRPVTRYRRTQKIGTYDFDLDQTLDGIRQTLNILLKTRGLPIPEQT